MVQNFIAGGAAVNQLCRVVDADLRVYEMNLDTPTGDIVVEPAMSEEECAKAIAYGMMAVEPGIDVLAIGEMGIGNTTAAAALCAGLFGGEAELWTGPGTGVAGAALESKRRAVAAAVALHRPVARDPFDLLRRLGGLELAAITGAVMAARLGRIPVVLDGFTSTAAAAVLFAADPHALDHCIVAHRLGRARPSRSARAVGPQAAVRSRHAARRGLGGDARACPSKSGGRLPQWDGDLCRGRGKRACVKHSRRAFQLPRGSPRRDLLISLLPRRDEATRRRLRDHARPLWLGGDRAARPVTLDGCSADHTA